MKKSIVYSVTIALALFTTVFFAASISAENADITKGTYVKARIGFITQEYIGDNIAEIPYIEYDGEKNHQIESINRSLNQGIQQVYDEFMSEADDRSWIEIKSYPFTTDKRLQVVVTSIIYPNYGTDGDMFSINYDKEADEWLDVDYALSIEKMDFDDLLFEVGELFEPDVSTQFIDEVKIAGFLIHEDKAKTYIEFLLELTVDNSAAESWKSFYSYIPKNSSLNQLDSFCLFDPDAMDQMDPPLSYINGD